jgi:diketogulonate reductase-like aldo/keto reductase
MMTRRDLTSSLLACSAAPVFTQPSDAQGAPRTVKTPGGTSMPLLGQGSWHLAQGRHPIEDEKAALRSGVSLGMDMIDTAELYGGGRAEDMIGELGPDLRAKIFLVSKVMPNHATASGIPAACAASLKRLKTDHLDLYLLHWRTSAVDLAQVVPAFEKLRAEGQIRAWGVSNFSARDMDDLVRVKDGDRCAANQILYNLAERGSERDVQPWCQKHGVPIMAYTPLGGSRTLANSELKRIAEARGVTPAAVALAWAIRNGNAVAIPESGSPAHVKENAGALSLQLGAKDLGDLDAAFPV